LIEDVRVFKMKNVYNALLDGILIKKNNVNQLMIIVENGKKMENVQVVIMDIIYKMMNVYFLREKY